MSDKTNPNSIGGPTEYAGFKAPKRADASTVAGHAGAYYDNPGNEHGNSVDRARINKTIQGYDPTKSTIKPAGTPSQFGY
jgi:hypothetical protein